MTIAVLIDRKTPPIIRDTNNLVATIANGLLAELDIVETAAFGEPGASDLEDWAEAVCRYAGAAHFARLKGLELTSDIDHAGVLIDLRAHITRDELALSRPNIVSAARSTPYAPTSAFAAHAQRPFVICHNDGDDEQFASYPSLSTGMVAAKGWRISRSHPVERLVWKQVTGPDKAYPVSTIDNDGKLPADLGFTAYAAGGLSMLQAHAQMGFETRYFVIDGQIVSGAGAIEAYTPFNRNEQALRGVTHPVFETRRNDGKLLVLPSMADVFDRRAPEIAADFARELGISDFVLDLFMNGATAQIGVVELNPINASGFYANAGVTIYARLGKALLSRAKLAVAA